MSPEERNRLVRDVLEREGAGPSVWGERDCITLIQSVIRELSGQEPILGLPDWMNGMKEDEAIKAATKQCGTLRAAWFRLLRSEPLLRPTKACCPGSIALTTVRTFVDRAVVIHGPLAGVIGPDCALWVRTPDGLRRAHPVTALWEIACPT